MHALKSHLNNGKRSLTNTFCDMRDRWTKRDGRRPILICSIKIEALSNLGDLPFRKFRNADVHGGAEWGVRGLGGSEGGGDHGALTGKQGTVVHFSFGCASGSCHFIDT